MRIFAALLLGSALIAGWMADRAPERQPRFGAGYRIIEADFHVHSFPGSWGLLAPWDMTLESRRQGLDAIALAPHNHVWTGKVGRWFAQRIGGPTVIASQEIVSPGYHMIALGVESPISWRQSAADAIEAIHRKGGVAIAAHPTARYWPAYDVAAMRSLDASEICRPFDTDAQKTEIAAFFQRRQLVPIGSSDQRGLGGAANCRTYVFARDASAAAIVDAVRERRTVVFARDGVVYGDPALAALVHPSSDGVRTGAVTVCSRVLGLCALLLLWFTKTPSS